MTQLEGNGGQRLLKLLGVTGAATPLYFTLGKVASISPISVRLDGETIDTPSEGIVVAEGLTEHKRTISISDDVGGYVDGYHGDGALKNIKIERKVLTIHAGLKVGDTVICGVGNDGQLVYILDKAVI